MAFTEKFTFAFSALALTTMALHVSGLGLGFDLGLDISGLVTIPGVSPQGSDLGPWLFLIYINDLPDCVNCLNVRLFADETILAPESLFHPLKNTEKCGENRALKTNTVQHEQKR